MLAVQDTAVAIPTWRGCGVRKLGFFLQWAIPLTHPEAVSSVGVWGSSPL